ncbi:hypothetical protein [Prosthecomicrobium sp. N25]|uniref:hypothetical protein n=1 Tax=Prosthecomicrobium sp. N25 TaxID=3129254 RepID=UPI003077CDBA
MPDASPVPNRRTALVLAGAGLLLAACGPATNAFEAVADEGDLPPHPAPAPAEGVKVMFLPFAGGAVTALDEVYRKIREVARRQGGPSIVQRLDEPATYRVRGVITAVGSNALTTFVFRIDVHDASGRRVHRFSGQEIGPAAQGDPWGALDKATTEHLALRIIDELRAWLNRPRV